MVVVLLNVEIYFEGADKKKIEILAGRSQGSGFSVDRKDNLHSFLGSSAHVLANKKLMNLSARLD